MTTLFDPIRFGNIAAANRIVMAPMARNRAGPGQEPTPLMATYYEQRATAGLIVSEATQIAPDDNDHLDTPGIYNAEQKAGWRRVTDAVHAKGGRIVLQLWHVGRISHPSFLDGRQPVAPSAIAAQGNVSLLRPDTPFPVPRPLAIEELSEVVEAYRQGARNAEAA